MENLDYLVSQFGETNEPIDENLLEDILEEVSVLEEQAFELALASVELGKPQILEYLLGKYQFTRSEISDLKKHVEDYVKHETKQGTSQEEIEEIGGTFEQLIKDAENPRKKKWKAYKHR